MRVWYIGSALGRQPKEVCSIHTTRSNYMRYWCNGSTLDFQSSSKDSSSL